MKINCPTCSRNLNVCDELGGRKVRCPGCQAEFYAPEAATEAPPPIAPPVYAEAFTSPPLPNASPFAIDIETDGRSRSRNSQRGNGLGNAAERSGSWIKRYREHCGTRSFILQALLAGWTAFILITGFGLFVSSISSATDAINSPIESERTSASIGVLFFGILCPLACYIGIALPLALAAIVTWEGGKRKSDN